MDRVTANLKKAKADHSSPQEDRLLLSQWLALESKVWGKPGLGFGLDFAVTLVIEFGDLKRRTLK